MRSAANSTRAIRSDARPRSSQLRRALFAAALSFVGLGSAAAHADVLGDLNAKFARFETEIGVITRGLQRPQLVTANAVDPQRQLVDAQVAFTVGKYDDAAILLFDFLAPSGAVATRPKNYDTGMYYLAESLYRKGDRVAAKGYFEMVVTEGGVFGDFYQPALERLVELGLRQHDPASVDAALLALDKIPVDKRAPSATYVEGKAQFERGQYDDALRSFDAVKKGSAHDFQAQYYKATTYIAKGDLSRATDILNDLVARTPMRIADRRVIELAQLAIGRLFYERDQPSKSIDSYLLIDRQSDLFDEALYEASWVYVKGKQYDKALGALELLALQDPSSDRLPTVKVLEGNLRVRKAQLLRAKRLNGEMLELDADPEAEYGKAVDQFTSAHALYVDAGAGLAKLIANNADPAEYLAQITGRDSTTFLVNSKMPEIAASWIRQEPSVSGVMSVENDLAEIQSDIGEIQRTLTHLDDTMSSAKRVDLFPELAQRHAKAKALQTDLFAAEVEMVEAEAAKLGHAVPSDVAAFTQARKAASAELAAVPAADKKYDADISVARAGYEKLEAEGSEVQVAVETAAANADSVRAAVNNPAHPIDELHKEKITTELTEVDPEVASIRTELASVRADISAARAEIGHGGAMVQAAKVARQNLRDALAAEHGALVRLVPGSDASQFDSLAKQAARVDNELDQLDIAMLTMADSSLGDLRGTLTAELKELESTRQEFLSAEAESRAVGGAVLGEAMAIVNGKLADVLTRTDVGVVDVAWSQKEENDEDLKRFSLSKQRELKQLRDEFRDLLEEDQPGGKSGGPGTGEKPAPTTAPATAPSDGNAAPVTPPPTPATTAAATDHTRGTK